MSSSEVRFHFCITPEESGRRLDEFLASRIGSVSRMRIATLLEEGACLVNQNAAPAGYHLVLGDSVEVAFDHSTPTAMSPEPIPLEIVHEDAHIVVVVKPAGMLAHPTRGVKTGTLANALAYHLNRSPSREVAVPGEYQPEGDSDLPAPRQLIRPGLAHRLDRATSGLMVIAKSQRALTVLSRHFHRRLIEKRYVAILQGTVAEDSFEIVAPIGRDPDRRPRWGVMETGRHAHTRITVLHRGEGLTVVEMEPVTGRTNQLRIHCAEAGHPVVGDDLYGCSVPDESAALQPFNAGSDSELDAAPARLCLHAWRLAFHHPVGGLWMEFTSAIPGDWPEAGWLVRPETRDTSAR